MRNRASDNGTLEGGSDQHDALALCQKTNRTFTINLRKRIMHSPIPTSTHPCLFLLIILAAIPFSNQASSQTVEPTDDDTHAISIVPTPKSVVVNATDGSWQLKKKISVFAPREFPFVNQHFKSITEPFKRLSSSELSISEDANESDITVDIDSKLMQEEYVLDVGSDRINLKAASVKGLSHATATLFQIIGQANNGKIRAMTIKDKPDCGYRSFMIDLGRNPHSFQLLMETVDLLWFYKMDSLHLHLTDDQRFAFPSKAFPKLQSRGELTWKEFEQVERHAMLRGISIIPELDVPGHSTILRREYPEVFGKNSADLAKLESSRKGIKTLLSEMIELFPSTTLIHVGGDEAGGVPEELQRDLINELHSFLKSKGKKTVVWEGPRGGSKESSVHPDVIHMNWRTINFPANQMLRAGHPVVNAAWDPLYIVDHYPRNNFTMASPEHIYRTMNLYKFAHYNPGMPTFLKPIMIDPQEYDASVIGFCMPWWEGREINFFPLITPRLIPMTEIAWNAKSANTNANNMKRESDYQAFAAHTKTCERIRQSAFYPVSINASQIALETEGVFHNRMSISLKAKLENADVDGGIRFTLDGSEPKNDSELFLKPIELNKSATLRAAVFANGNQVGYGTRKTFTAVSPMQNLALGKPVSTSVGSGPFFSANRLTDGGTGNLDYYLGYPAEPKPIEITIDLKKVFPVKRVVTHAFYNGNVFESYRVQVSVDGKSFRTVADRTQKPEKPTAATVHDFDPTDARYIRILTRGCKGYVFDSFSKLTEIQVF